MNYWPSVKSKKPTIQREFRGVNKLDSFSIGDSFATEATNLTSSKYPALTTRLGFSLLGSGFVAAVNGLGAWKDSELQAISGGTWYKYSGGAWSGVTGGTGLATADASFANFKGGFAGINLIMANGVVFKKYDGVSVTNLATAPAGGNYVEQFADRLWCAVGNDLKYTAYRVGDDWTTINGDDADSGFITVESPNGETINGVKAGLSAMTLFKPSSIHKLMGYAPSDYTLITVTREIGVLNNKCAVTIQGVMYILDDTGLYKYYGSTLPDKSFSEVVQYYIDNMNKAASSTCFLASDGRYLYAAIPMAMATTPDTLIVYDTQFKIWYVYKDWSPTCGVKMGNDLYLGESTGKVIKPSGTTDGGLPIAFKWVSKPFGSGSMNQRIRWYRTWLVVDVAPGSYVTVSVSNEPILDSWTTVQTITGTLQSVRMPVNLGALAMGNWLRVKFEGAGPVTIYEWDREQEEMPLI
ncbi:hypothetical protein [Paenibacillus sp. LjRoot56]|uniref:hypothetical protein n=1 Tax=Paenibacillus sp. LjRoot56 TaxID=3342333 RepID=UPI003ECCC411